MYAILLLFLVALTSETKITLHKATRARKSNNPRALASHAETVLDDYRNVYYYGPVTVGEKTFQLVFDTGSSFLWVPGTACSDTCASHPQYTGTQPQVGRFREYYGSGTVSGMMLTGEVSIGEGLSVKDFTFGSADFVGFDQYDVAKYDGIIGMAWPSLAPNSRVSTITSALKKQGSIQKDMFSIYLGSDEAGDGDGKVYLGEVSRSSHKGDVVYFTVVTKAWWTLYLTLGTVNGKKFVDTHHVSSSTTASSCWVIIDSGTSFIIGPGDSIQSLLNVIHDSVEVSQSGSGYFVATSEVNKLPIISFTLQGANDKAYTFQLTGEQYSIPNSNGWMQLTFGALQASSGSPGWILGAPFMRAFYSVFDYEEASVGFAVSSSNSHAGAMKKGTVIPEADPGSAAFSSASSLVVCFVFAIQIGLFV